MNLSQRIAAARGQDPVDLLLTNLQLVNVFSGEIYPSEIAIKDGLIVGVGPGYCAGETIDLGGRYVAPGLIDAHIHIESSMCTPPVFSEAVLEHGVTTVITDPHEIANVHGMDGIRFMLESARGGYLSIFVMAPSCVPATRMEHAGSDLSADDLAALLDDPSVLGLAEVMNYPGVYLGDPNMLAKIEKFSGRVRDGHCPGLTGHELNAYVIAGISSDHECTTVEEAHEKLQTGMVIFIREGTGARNLLDLLPLVTPETSRRICWCSDDRHPADLLDVGTIDNMIRVAVAQGLDPMTAIRLGTLNPAEYFRLHDRGAIAPGRRADLIVFSDLHDLRAERVYSRGKLVAQDGVLKVKIVPPPVAPLPPAINIDWDSVDFAVPANGTRIHVIDCQEHSLLTGNLVEDATIKDGCVVADPARDILKMAVIERHHACGCMGTGFIHGMGLKRGAIAGTVAHDHHNLVVVGADDASMMTAAHAVERLGGGLVAVDGERVLAGLPLPVGGLMSDQPIQTVREALDHLLAVTHRELGSPMHDPFMTMSFMALEVIPSLKLTDVGLVDVDKFEVVDLFA